MARPELVDGLVRQWLNKFAQYTNYQQIVSNMLIPLAPDRAAAERARSELAANARGRTPAGVNPYVGQDQPYVEDTTVFSNVLAGLRRKGFPGP